MSTNARMSLADFNRLSSFIRTQYGINLPPTKKFLLESRLQKRLQVLGFGRFHEYCDWVMSPSGHREEGVQMMNLVSTNKTDFFREPHHFDFLQSYLLPEITHRTTSRNLHLWSAGCSSGEEPYTLAMVLAEYADKHHLPDFTIYGTDISTQVLEKAVTGVYPEECAIDIPINFRQKYLLKSRDQAKKMVRIAPAIRSKVQFGRLNFMEEHYQAPYSFDIVFCRNVLIYFDKPTQETVIRRLCNHLRKGGVFFLGHSESIASMDVPLEQIKPTIFRRI